MNSKNSDLLSRAIKGERGALARLLSISENDISASAEIELSLLNSLGVAKIVGVTGPPGAGKSSVIAQLLNHTKEEFDKTAVIAVDPSSPFTKGALLGDRVRMEIVDRSKSIFIRSMASRGNHGGLARSTTSAITLFDGCGWPLIIVETLGIGQIELDIASIADVTVVVLTPGWGDNFQANKAGLTESGDIYVVNKSDRPGAAKTRIELEESLSLLPHSSTSIPVLETIATKSSGIDDLWKNIMEKCETSESNTSAKKYSRRSQLIHRLLKIRVDEAVNDCIQGLYTEFTDERQNIPFEEANASLNRLVADVAEKLKPKKT
ncbi:MAG: methylmalonyl Co-A mutase-associated GTPase MeaB [Halieaceae bacterium]|nr:methylmalonyl Co-A mutase-associated GTPase MeaB [Halieaceae bacterium]